MPCLECPIVTGQQGPFVCLSLNQSSTQLQKDTYNEDDIHFIHAPRKPTSSVTSTSWHMCTVLADIHCNIHAVPQNDDFKLNHWSARVVMPDGAIRECRGGIDIDHLLGYFRVELPKYFSSSFLSSLPRVYWDAERHEMESLRTSWLLDEFQQSLHSKNDYAAALEHTLGVCPELEEYMKEFQLVVTGDYPTLL